MVVSSARLLALEVFADRVRDEILHVAALLDAHEAHTLAE